MDQLINVMLTIYKVHTAPQRALDCGPGKFNYEQLMYKEVLSIRKNFNKPKYRIYIVSNLAYHAEEGAPYHLIRQCAL